MRISDWSSDVCSSDLMSHELRTPLNAVIGFADMLRMELYGPMPPRYRDTVQTIATSGRHLLELINDLLDLARIEAGAVELQAEWVDLAGVAHATARMLEPLADERGVGMRIDGRNGPRARCDRRAVQQILINVVGNAIKFGPENGEVVVGFRDGEQVEIRVRRSEEHTSELQSLMRISYAVFCLKKKNKKNTHSRYRKHIHKIRTEQHSHY